MMRRRLINKSKMIIKRRQPDGGFTIIESLLAIIVVGILLVGIAPVIALSVATRVQARRIESATQAARTYIEGTRAQSIQAPNARVTLEANLTPGLVFAADAVSPPSKDELGQCLTKDDAKNKVKCSTNSYIENPLDGKDSSLYCFDVDGDGGCSADSIQDMIVQAFRSTNLEDGTPVVDKVLEDDATKGYVLGIRVYRADAFNSDGNLKASNADSNVRADTFAGGLGDRKAPLVEMTTDITIRGPIDGLFSNICTRLGSKNPDVCAKSSSTTP